MGWRGECTFLEKFGTVNNDLVIAEPDYKRPSVTVIINIFQIRKMQK